MVLTEKNVCVHKRARVCVCVVLKLLVAKLIESYIRYLYNALRFVRLVIYFNTCAYVCICRNIYTHTPINLQVYMHICKIFIYICVCALIHTFVCKDSFTPA